jgi:hypothetical protein
MSDTPFFQKPHPATERYATYVTNPWVGENRYLSIPPESAEIPTYQQAREILPSPFWAGHEAAVDCYWRAWQLAFSNLKQPTAENRFVANYCDTAFNGNLFMWDSAFITRFGEYARRAFDFQKTLDNLYTKQHPDGFICREISEADGQDAFHRFDPSSTGPNVLAWVEWSHFLKTGDRNRLEMVFSPLVAYHQWTRAYRTWPDGSYWSTGWGTGMDNLPRLPGNGHPNWDHGHMTWVDATLQAVLSARSLIKIAVVLGCEDAVPDLSEEADRLTRYVNQSLWDDQTAFYYDRLPNGELSRVKHIGAFWALLAGVVPSDRLPSFIGHLENPAEFCRGHRIPSLSADDPAYSGLGGYWCGGIWAPTNYMAIKGLAEAGYADLAYQIARNHNEQVVTVFTQKDTHWTGAEQFRQYFRLTDLQFDDNQTLWENYAPDHVAPGDHSKPGYVGWTGIPPIAVLFEDIFGLTPDVPANRLTWHVRLLEEYGVHRYPYGSVGMLDLKCLARESSLDRPHIEIHSDVPLTLDVVWEGGKDTIQIEKSPG